MTGVTLRASDHTYWAGPHVRVMGAGEALTTIGILDDFWYDDRGVERGELVHKYTALKDLGASRQKLAALRMPTEWRGYVKSWDLWTDRYRPRHLLVETSLWDPVRHIAGTKDRVSIILGRGFKPHLGIVDLKTGDLEPWHGLQLSIYDLLVEAWLQSGAAPPGVAQLPRVLYGVYLHEDGSYPKVRTFPPDPATHAIITAAQTKARLFRSR